MEISDLTDLSLCDLRKRFFDQEEPIPAGLLEALKADPRSGARILADRIEARRRERREEAQRLRRLLEYERELWARGVVHVAGVDEAGVAPLAGPVVAAACILPHDFRPIGIDDSKKLGREEREALEIEIKKCAIAWSLGATEVSEIDTINIYQASLLAMRRAVEGLSIKPDFLLVDARTVPGVDIPQRGIIHGDALSLTIAAASILAKTGRDRLLLKLGTEYPGYGFENHKGYPTPEHFEALKRLGASPIHRRSFAPVRDTLNIVPAQTELPLVERLAVGGQNSARDSENMRPIETSKEKVEKRR